MKLLDRYIAGVVISGTAVALLVIMGLNVFFEVIRQIDDVGEGTFTLVTMLQYVALTLPRSMYELFPTAALLGGLTGLGALSVNSELVAMRACGFKIWRIVRSVMQAGLLMMVVVVAIGEFIAPTAEQFAQQMRAFALDKRIDFMGTFGLWVRDESRYIFAKKVISEDSLADLSVFEFDDKRRLVKSTHVNTARYKDGEWVLQDVRQSIISEDQVTTRNEERLAWPSLLTPELIGIVVLKPDNMSIPDIQQFIGYLEENGLDSQQYRYAYWKRFMTPLSALVLLFIAVPFVFGSQRSTGNAQRIFVGVLAGFGFYMLSQVSGQIGMVYGINPLVASLTPTLVVLLLGLNALRRL
ncbi:MAG: LPS export ABC transporter permease LptG [Thiohalobacterales bacterium]